MIREVLRYPHPALKQVARELAPDEQEEIARVAAGATPQCCSSRTANYQR